MKNSFASGRELTPSELEFHVGELGKQGYTIIPDAVDAEYLAPAIEAAEDIYRRESEIALRLGTSSEHCWSAHCIVGKHPFFETFYLNPAVLSVCREYLGEDMVLYDTTARSIRPSEGREPGTRIPDSRRPVSVQHRSLRRRQALPDGDQRRLAGCGLHGRKRRYPGLARHSQILSDPRPGCRHPGIPPGGRSRGVRPLFGTRRFGTPAASTAATTNGIPSWPFFNAGGSRE